jgi:hypothetical protein
LAGVTVRPVQTEGNLKIALKERLHVQEHSPEDRPSEMRGKTAFPGKARPGNIFLAGGSGVQPSPR